MTRDFQPRAEPRVAQLATETAEQFDATLLFNRVHETVDGQHNRHHDLLRGMGLAERAYTLSVETYSDVLDDEVFAAARHLERPIDGLGEVAVALACATIITDAGDWTDAWDRADIPDVRAEVSQWLADRLEATERAATLAEVADA